MLPLVARKVLVRLLVILPELFDDVLTDIAVLLFDLARDLQLVFGRYVRHLSAFTHEVQHELGDVATCDGDVLDGTSNDVPLRAGNDMSNTITGVNDSTRKRAVCDAVRGPRRSESEDRLYGNVQALDVE